MRDGGPRVKFVSITAVPGEDGGEVLLAVDKIGQIWRGEITTPGGKPTWTEIAAPSLPEDVRQRLSDAQPNGGRRFRD